MKPLDTALEHLTTSEQEKILSDLSTHLAGQDLQGQLRLVLAFSQATHFAVAEELLRSCKTILRDNAPLHESLDILLQKNLSEILG